MEGIDMSKVEQAQQKILEAIELLNESGKVEEDVMMDIIISLETANEEIAYYFN